MPTKIPKLENVGTGAGKSFKAETEANTCQLKSIKAGSSISISNGSSDITVNNTRPENTNAASVGAGAAVYRDQTADTLNFKSLIAGTAMQVVDNGDDITITNTAPENTSAANVGTGAGVFKTMTGYQLDFKSIKAGANITIAPAIDEITIAATGGSADHVVSEFFSAKRWRNFLNITDGNYTNGTVFSFDRKVFADNANDKKATICFALPSNWKAASAIKARIYWHSIEDTTNLCTWQIGAASLADQEAIASAITYVSQTDAPVTPDAIFITSEITLSFTGTPAPGELLYLVVRINGATNVNGDVYFIGAKLEYTITD